MKQIICFLYVMFFFCPLWAQDYPQIVSLQSTEGIQGTFLSAGEGVNKKKAKENAIKSLFYTLFFQGVDGVNDNQALVCNEKEQYTNSFFNTQARCNQYVIKVEEAADPSQKGALFQCTMKVTIRLKQLVSDVKKNTCVNKEPVQLPTIMVVPFTKSDEESMEAIMKNDFEMAIAISTLRDGFRSRGVTTYDLLTVIEREKIRGNYRENAGTIESNDKQLLLASGADVYVKVRLNRVKEAYGTRVSMIMEAIQTATGKLLASKNYAAEKGRNISVEAMAKNAVQSSLKEFLDEICKNFDPISSISLQFSLLDGGSIMSFNDRVGNGNVQLGRLLTRWVHSNSRSFDDRGINGELLMYESVVMPEKTEDGYNMNAMEYAYMLQDFLDKNGVKSTFRIDTNMIIIIIE